MQEIRRSFLVSVVSVPDSGVFVPDTVVSVPDSVFSVSVLYRDPKKCLAKPILLNRANP